MARRSTSRPASAAGDADADPHASASASPEPPAPIPVKIEFSFAGVPAPPAPPPPPVVLPADLAPAAPAPGRPVMLDDAIVALQKSFSRVNARTQKNRDDHPDQPTALIIGNVQFEMTVTLAPARKSLVAEPFAGLAAAAAPLASPAAAGSGSGLAGKAADADATDDHGRVDAFEVTAGGPISLTFRGTLDTDVRIDANTSIPEQQPESRQPQPDPPADDDPLAPPGEPLPAPQA